MYKVAVTDCGFDSLDVEKAILEPLGCEVIRGKCKTPDDVIALTSDADCVINGFAPITAAAIAAMKKARVIVRYGIGVDSVDLAAAAKQKIPVCNVPDYCIHEVADHTLAFILSLTRQIVPNWDTLRGGIWKLGARVEDMRTLRDMTVGLVAFGRIGREVAARLRPFQCRVVVFDPVVEASVIQAAGCCPMGWDELLTTSDVLSLHCPSTPKTRGMINRDTLARMKKGALFVNASRGDLVVTEDLVAALRNGPVIAAALDVTSPEPLPKDSPLFTMSNVIISPHIASLSAKSLNNLRTSVANTVAKALKGEKLANVVNGVA